MPALGYDLHIVRTRLWVDAADKPILKAEVDALVAGDRDPGWSTSDYIETSNPVTGDSIRITARHPTITLKGDSCFWYQGTSMTCKNPSEFILIKMVQMARALNAMVVGDEDELYEVRKTLFGAEKIISKPWAG